MISVTIQGLSEFKDKVQKYRKSMPERKKEFLLKLAEIGIDAADISFKRAHYDGVNDVTVSPTPKWHGSNTLIISATGQTITFIEFGTGITYADDHPLAQEFGMIRGEYGQGKGKQDSWVYYGEEGTMGEWLRTVDNQYVIRTRGNPANRCMYDAGKKMRDETEKIAKEVFRFD